MAEITIGRAGRPAGGLSIGEAARRSGVHLETIRYWERLGILPSPPRSRAGRRLYGALDLARLRFVRRARALGFPLAAIRRLLELADESAPCERVEALARRQLAEVQARRALLARLEAVLAQTLDSCTRGDPRCPLLAALAEPESTLDRLLGAADAEDQEP